jgi:AcrR family transcriptional regulator
MATLVDILQKAEQLFFKFGIKSISMDDLSKEMRISKKTLYSFVANKEELVFLVIKNHLHEEKIKVDETVKQASNSIEEFVMILMYNYSQINEMNASTLYDIQKYYPQSWDQFTEYKEKYIQVYILQNLQKGIKEGLYRSELNPEIIALIYVNSIDTIFNISTEKFNKNDIGNMLREYVTYHLHGIVSDQGKEYLHNYLNKTNQ